MQGDIAQLKNAIEHTLLKPDAQKADICTLAQEAIANNFFGVCVNSSFVEIAKKELALSNVKLVCVISFPLGAVDFESKAFETDRAIKNGADEVDMVIHLGALKAKDTAWVKKDIAAVVRAAQGHPVKVIIETALLNNEEKTLACILSAEAGAHFVKTCTGFSGGSATVADIELMKKAVQGLCKIKASGGIKTTQLAYELLAAGASRLGTSSGVSLVAGTQNTMSGSY